MLEYLCHIPLEHKLDDAATANLSSKKSRILTEQYSIGASLKALFHSPILMAHYIPHKCHIADMFCVFFFSVKDMEVGAVRKVQVRKPRTEPSCLQSWTDGHGNTVVIFLS